RSRSGAALAAASFAVFIAVITSVMATARYSNTLDYFGPNLPADQLVVYESRGDGPTKQQPAPGAGNSLATVDAVAAALGTSDVLRLEAGDAMLGVAVGSRGVFGYGGDTYVATPELLRHYGIDPASIDPGALFITSRPGLTGMPNLRLMVGGETAREVADPKIQRISRLPTGTAQPNLLLTEHAVQAYAIQPRPGAWLVRVPRPLTSAQINSARQLAAAAGMTIETRSQAPSLDQLRDYATLAGLLLALGVLAMSVGLIRAESTRDLQTLTATGAGSGVRRRITGATAGTLGLLGALLGTGAAYLAAVALFHDRLGQQLGQVPVRDLVLIVVGLPVAAAAGSWLLAGREPPVVSRQPIE
ncbi:MAG TPA: hypothetical protein VJT31_17445, partial [Rugosimonospora sp.]|nr:hypothetical protein [Rugosimonospora sp.]